jgi:hypothetical protein
MNVFVVVVVVVVVCTNMKRLDLSYLFQGLDWNSEWYISIWLFEEKVYSLCLKLTEKNWKFVSDRNVRKKQRIDTDLWENDCVIVRRWESEKLYLCLRDDVLPKERRSLKCRIADYEISVVKGGKEIHMQVDWQSIQKKNKSVWKDWYKSTRKTNSEKKR